MRSLIIRRALPALLLLLTLPAAAAPPARSQVDEWFRMSVRGDPAAAFSLGQREEFGDGTPKNVEAAKAWYRSAALKGHTGAQFNLGLLLIESGEAPDPEAAVWLRHAADHGHAKAARALSEVYRAGLGVPADEAQSLYWWLQAAHLGDGVAKAQAVKRLAKVQRLTYRSAMGVARAFPNQNSSRWDWGTGDSTLYRLNAGADGWDWYYRPAGFQFGYLRRTEDPQVASK